MKVALPEWEGRISPVFDVATKLLTVEIDGGREVSRSAQTLAETLIPLRVKRLGREGVNVLLCAGISTPLLLMLEQAGIKVIPGISGPIEPVLEAYLAHHLSDARFATPGWRGPKGRRFRGGRQRW